MIDATEIPHPNDVLRRWYVAVQTLLLEFWARLTGQYARATSQEDLTDRDLVRLVLEGRSGTLTNPPHGLEPNDAYALLVQRHQTWLLRLLVSLLGSQADAEDVAQEVFVRAFLSLDSFRNEANLRSWLRTIAMRTAFNWKRGRKTSQKYEQAAYKEDIEGHVAAPASRPLIARDTLTKLIGSLSYPYREILILRYVEELAIKEISKVLEISLSAAKMRLKRAREEFSALHAELD